MFNLLKYSSMLSVYLQHKHLSHWVIAAQDTKSRTEPTAHKTLFTSTIVIFPRLPSFIFVKKIFILPFETRRITTKIVLLTISCIRITNGLHSVSRSFENSQSWPSWFFDLVLQTLLDISHTNDVRASKSQRRKQWSRLQNRGRGQWNPGKGYRIYERLVA